MSQIISMKYGDQRVLIQTDESEFESKLSRLASELEESETLELLGNEDEESTDTAGLLQRVKDLLVSPVKKVERFFDERLIEGIVRNCDVLTKAFIELKAQSEIPPSTAHVEFGLKFTGEGNVYITKFAGEANFRISVDWDLKLD